MISDELSNKERPMILKKKLSTGERVVGTWNLFSDPCAIEIMCKAGFDYLIHDMEHGAHSLGQIKSMIRAAEVAGKTLLLRPPSVDRGLIQRALDAGCHGLMVPNIETAQDVAAIIDCALYPPVGNRGLSPYTRAMGYDGTSVSDRMAALNKNMFLGILVESHRGITHLADILEQHGQYLDVVYIGLYDLAKSLGSTDNLMSDKMQAAIQEVCQLTNKSDVASGMLVSSPEMTAFARKMGVRFFAYQNDTSILFRAVSDINRAIRHDN